MLHALLALSRWCRLLRGGPAASSQIPSQLCHPDVALFASSDEPF